MNLAKKDLEIIKLNDDLDNDYKNVIYNYNQIKKKAKQNSYLKSLVDEYYSEINKFKKTKIKQIKALYVIIKHIKLLNNDEKNRNELKSITKEIRKLEKIIKHLNI